MWYNCGDFDCKAGLLDGFIDVYGKSDISEGQLSETFSEYLNIDPQLNAQQRSDLLLPAVNKFIAYRAQHVDSASIDAEQQEIVTQQSPQGSPETPGTNDAMTYRLVQWSKGIVDDLGLGFDWAAFQPCRKALTVMAAMVLD